MMKVLSVLVTVLLFSPHAVGAEKEAAGKDGGGDPPKPTVGPVTVIYKNDGDVEPRLQLKTFEIGYEERGLFGASFQRLEKLPVRNKRSKLKVDFSKIARIEVDASDKKGAPVRLIVHAKPGSRVPMFEGVLDSEKKLVWRGIHPFADSVATLDLTQVKEIRFEPKPKQEPPAG
jgi:hypothetical protein